MAYLPEKSQGSAPVRLGMVGGGNDAFIGEVHRKVCALDNVGISPILPPHGLMARLDGRAFHTFTRGMKRPYERNG